MSESGKKLSELRVSDLKDELEKRNLDTIGAKATLMERLEKVLRKEGLDPAKYLFGSGSKLSTPKKGSASEAKSPTIDASVKIKEEPFENDTPKGKGSNKPNKNGKKQKNGHEGEDEEVDQVGTVDDECVVIDDEEGDENEEENEEEDYEDENEADNAVNNQDNEESLNLTIGEDEQNFLHDEADDKDKTETAGQKGGSTKNTEKKSNTSGNKNANTEKKSNTKDDEANKAKKKDEKTGDKKDESDQKSTTKSSPKDDKEKTNAASNSNSNAAKTSSNNKPATVSRNLWVSGLSALTRASDLKTIFTKYGKVIGAKVVTNTRTPGTRCYGFVTMSSAGDATRCIEHLHHTELHGRIISVERTRKEIGSSAAANKDVVKNADNKKKDDDKKSTSSKYDDKRRSDHSKRGDSKKDDKDKTKRDDKDKNTRDTSRDARNNRVEQEFRRRERERERQREIRQREILSYQKIREERERQRLREKERELREEDRRRREIRDRQRHEEQRLAEERKKLALERERLEREKAELLRLERERQKLEREKIELERLELKRQHMKIIQGREDPKRASKRSDDRYVVDTADRKRVSGNDRGFEAPPPPRFDASMVASRSYDKKREEYLGSSTKRVDDYPPSRRDDYPSTGSKRSAVDDYPLVPTKRTSDGYMGSSSSKRIDDYSSTGKSSRDDYKREVEVRHIPVASGVSNSFHRDISSVIHKPSSGRYMDNDRTSGGFRRGIDDLSGNKRYDNPSAGGYGGNSGGGGNSSLWTPSMSGGNNSILPPLKSYVSNGLSSNMHGGGSSWQKSMNVDDSNWRPVPNSQDRYDRTYNERSSGYPSGGGGGNNMYSNSGGGRYGGPSRY